jgi:hypothetical protein
MCVLWDAKAEHVSRAITWEDSCDRDLLVVAGYIHDIGYAPGFEAIGASST